MANQVMYGFTNLVSLFDRRLAEVNEREIFTAIDDTVAEHNRQMAALNAIFVDPTTEYKRRYNLPAVARLQPGTATSTALPIEGYGSYDIAFPLQIGDGALGIDWMTRAKITVRELNNKLATLITADARWMRDHILAALFANASWSFTDKAHGALTIQGLANGDSVVYPIMTGADQGATDTHYLAQAAAIDNSNNPFPTIFDELTEHEENSGEVVVFIPTTLKATVEALATYKAFPDTNIQYGNASDILQGDLGIQTPGRLIGYVNECWIVWWRALPSGYMVATTTGGDRPLAMREEPEAELRGFQRVADTSKHPYYEEQWKRIAGFGGQKRTGAVVYRIGNASYAVPTNYGVPMP